MKKLRYKRVIFVCSLFLFTIGVGVYLVLHINHFYDYDGEIQTVTCTYRQNSKIYTFDLRTFVDDDHRYVSLNDMYNMVLLLDSKTKVYLKESQHILVYEMSNNAFYFHYGQDEVRTDDTIINVNENGSHLYKEDKHIFIDVHYVEQLFFQNKKTISFKEKTAIIK